MLVRAVVVRGLLLLLLLLLLRWRVCILLCVAVGLVGGCLGVRVILLGIRLLLLLAMATQHVSFALARLVG